MNEKKKRKERNKEKSATPRLQKGAGSDHRRAEEQRSQAHKGCGRSPRQRRQKHDALSVDLKPKGGERAISRSFDKQTVRGKTRAGVFKVAENMDSEIAIVLKTREQLAVVKEAAALMVRIQQGELEAVPATLRRHYPGLARKWAVLQKGYYVFDYMVRLLRVAYAGGCGDLGTGTGIRQAEALAEKLAGPRGLRIACTVREALFMVRALNLFSRLLMGQLREVDWVLRETFWDRIKNHDPHIVDHIYALMAADAFGFIPNESYGIASKKLAKAAKTAYEILRWVEHDLHKDNPEIQKGYTVLKYEPLRVTKQPRIEVKK